MAPREDASCGAHVADKSPPCGWAKRLTPTFVAKPWGRRDGLPGPADAQPLGEVVYEANSLGLVVKWLQTSEALSIQVHPRGSGRKHEWWQVIEARPGAYIDLGLKASVSPESLAAAARDGSLPELMNRIAPSPGDSFYIEAGTIHALGPGLTVLEIQEASDVTYRLFDYGRPRELHLAQGVSEALLEPNVPRAFPGDDAPFAVTPILLGSGDKVVVTPERGCLAVVSGEGELAGHAFSANECWLFRGPVALSARTQSTFVLAEPRPHFPQAYNHGANDE